MDSFGLRAWWRIADFFEYLFYWIINPVRMFRYHHWHVLKMEDMAVGVECPRGIAVTGWKYKCRLCNKRFYVIAEDGWEQLGQGHHPDEVFSWMRDRMEGGGEGE